MTGQTYPVHLGTQAAVLCGVNPIRSSVEREDVSCKRCLSMMAAASRPKRNHQSRWHSSNYVKDPCARCGHSAEDHGGGTGEGEYPDLPCDECDCDRWTEEG